jgi:hypothetical protein
MPEPTYEELKDKFEKINSLRIMEIRELFKICDQRIIEIANLKSNMKELQSKYCLMLAENYLLKDKKEKL